jgi:hypothetical protein
MENCGFFYYPNKSGSNKNFKVNICLLYDLYCVKKLSKTEVAKILKISRPTCGKVLIALNFPVRSISEQLTGRNITWGAKIGEAQRGRRVSEETKIKISESRITAKIVPITKGLRKATSPDKVTWGVSGEKHWNWKGGISTDRIRFRQSSEYKSWRDSVFIRDNYTCTKCGKRGTALRAHHIIPFSKLYSDGDFNKILDVSIGTTLCVSCHNILHFGHP